MEQLLYEKGRQYGIFNSAMKALCYLVFVSFFTMDAIQRQL